MSAKLAMAYVEIRASHQNLKSDLKRVENTTRNSMNVIGGVIAAAGGLAGSIGILRWGENLAKQAETANTAINVILKDMTKTRDLIKDVNLFSTKTPFTPKELRAATQSMLAFNVEAGNITSRLKTLGDITAGSNSRLNEVVAIFNKIKATGKLTGETFLQLAERGINVKDVLVDELGIGADEFAEKVRGSEISFEDVLKAMEKMTSKGGIFFDAMNQQSETWNGKLSTIDGNIGLIGEAFGTHLIQAGKAAQDVINSMLVTFIEMDETTGGLITQTLAYSSAIATLVISITAARVAMKAFGITAKSVLVGTGIGAGIVLIGFLLATAISAYGKLRDIMSGALDGVKEWNPIVDNLMATWLVLKDTVVIVWSAIKEAAMVALIAIKAVWTSVVGQFEIKWMGILNLATLVMLGIATTVKTATENIGLSWNIVTTSAKFAFMYIADIAINAFKQIPNMAWEMVRTVADIMLLIPQIIVAAISNEDPYKVISQKLTEVANRHAKLAAEVFKPSSETVKEQEKLLALQGEFGEKFKANMTDALVRAKEIRESRQRAKEEIKEDDEVKKAVTKKLTVDIKAQFVGFEDLNKLVQDSIFKKNNPNAKLENQGDKQVTLLGDQNGLLGEIRDKLGGNVVADGR